MVSFRLPPLALVMNTSCVASFGRAFCNTPVGNAAMIKPAVPVFGVEGRYATALYSASSKEKKLDSVEKELKTLKELLLKDKPFAEFVLNPLVKRSDKKAAISKILSKKNYGPLVVNLLGVLSDNGRLKNLIPVIDCFCGIMSNQRGEVVCKITSAKPLDATQIKEFEDTLKTFVKKGEKILLQTEVDPEIIGGVIISIGDKYIDMSMSTKIKTYTNLLKEAY